MGRSIKNSRLRTWHRLPLDVITEAAYKYGLDTMLVAAIVATESDGDTFAVRYEPGYRWLQTEVHTKLLAQNLNITIDTEIILQKCSWGLMQIMGSTARDHGYVGPLPKLCEPKSGVNIGCIYLRALANRFTSVDDVISAYNAGSPKKQKGGLYFNQVYVDKVLRARRALRDGD